MATIARFTLPSESFLLGVIFKGHPDATIELERIVPTGQTVVPYFWIRDSGEAADIEAEFVAHSEVDHLEVIDTIAGGHLVRVDWASEYGGILEAIVELDVALVSAEGSATDWSFEIRADDRESIAAFQEYCHEHDLPITLTSIHALSETDLGATYGLTDEQHEALVLAHQRGYYESPREVALGELADELEITRQSVGSRLRRGINRLIGNTLDNTDSTGNE